MNRRALTRFLTSTAPRFVFGCCFFLYVVIPLLVLCFPSIPAVLVFLNMVGWPAARFCNFKDPAEAFGLEGARNFYLTSAPGVTLGVWHIAPRRHQHDHHLSSSSSSPPPHIGESSSSGFFEGGRPVILYLHGNSAHRASAHRVQLYQLLSSMGYEVVCFDYRGYGDSTGSPSETGLVHDALFVYRWILERKGASQRVFLWGHSLGTGVACHVGRKIFEAIDAGDSTLEAPHGIVLESPFSNLKEEVREHKFAKPFRWLPFFDFVFLGAFDRVNVLFQSDVHVRHIRAPILFLHADDDPVIPFHLCQRLYESSKKMENGEIRGGEERVEIARGVDKVKVSLALANIKPVSSMTMMLGSSMAELSDANENRKSAPNLANGVIGGAGPSSPPPPPIHQFRREFVGFTGSAGYRHKWLVNAPEMKPIVEDFIGTA